jgi:transposase InsO family protein
LLGGKRYFVTFIVKFSQYTLIYFVRNKSDVKTVFQMFYNLVETQFSTKIKKLKSDNGGEYVNNKITAFLEMKGIIHNLSPPYTHESNGLPERMNGTIVTMVRSMTLDYADVIPQALWAEACSTAIHIKNRLPHSAFKLKKSPSKIMFGDKPSIKHVYPFREKCYVYVPEEIQIRTSKLSSM